MSKPPLLVTLAGLAAARYIAICPPDWKYGVAIGAVSEAPLARMAKPLHWDTRRGIRVR